jgi:hypothetical protein
MNTVANTLRRLAPCTSPLQCAHRARNSFMATLNRILKSPHASRAALNSTSSIVNVEKPAPQNHSPEVRILFNIHNPSQDHRDRSACAFLLTS